LSNIATVNACIILIAVLLVSTYTISPSAPAIAQLQTIVERDLTIELDGQVLTNAKLTLPTVGAGPFPAVLLIHGSGAADMDGYIPPELSGTENGSRIFLQIAEYLSERGFVVLRYDKRGIGENATILNPDVFGNATVQQLQRDAEKALDVLLQQPEVNKEEITLLGVSEGTTIAPRIAVQRPDDIKNIVLMGAASQTLYDIMYANLVNRTILFGRNTWDDNQDGLLSLQEVLAHPGAYLTVPSSSVAATSDNFTSSDPQIDGTADDNNNTAATAASTASALQEEQQQQWYPGLDANNDTLVNIDQELTPFAIALFGQMVTSAPWLQSHREIAPNIETIESLSPTTSVLILQGEEDNQTYLEQALLLEQKLTEMGHQDHTLITYAGLGHTFHPAQELLQPLGPIEDYVLRDLHSWLKNPDRMSSSF
jgi:alpha-beta hydrolase superfamily lysophospholipase